MTSPPPLTGIKVLEFAGLAPGPFAGMLLADYGASVLRIDRTIPSATHSASTTPPPTPDFLARHKTSISLDLKSPSAISLLYKLIPSIDVLIDPFRPGVLEKLGLGPEILRKLNPKLIYGRMTGFRRDGKYRDMAGHDINYIAVSGALSIFGRKGEKPYPPLNVLGDFAGGGAVLFQGVLLALLEREKTGRGQVVEANMVDGSAYLTSMLRFIRKTPTGNQPRGQNILDTGCPWYDTYETKDSKYVGVGALEPQFFIALLEGLGLQNQNILETRDDRSTWPKLKQLFTETFKAKDRAEWEKIFDGKDACVTPVLDMNELERDGWREGDQRPLVTLSDSPGWAIKKGEGKRPPAEGQGKGVRGDGHTGVLLAPSVGGEEKLKEWVGWERGRDYEVVDGGLVAKVLAKI